MILLRPMLTVCLKVVAFFLLVSLQFACQKMASNQANEGHEAQALAYLTEDVQSPKTALKLKRTRVLRNSLAKILALHPQQLCLELGRLPCADVVHRVSLGGMDAYGNSQYKFPENLSVSSPIAMDRIVLASCSTRASLDLVNPNQGVIFKNLHLTPDGRITKNEAFYDSIRRLYERALLRQPRVDEVQALEKLYVDIYEHEPIGAARNWALLSCYAVLSSLESIFY
ncbi:MAG: hypothetical protein ACOH5I_08365 [Oligoflexus sp.]